MFVKLFNSFAAEQGRNAGSFRHLLVRAKGRMLVWLTSTLVHLFVEALVVRRLDNTSHWINLHQVDNAVYFSITYPLNSDLYVG